MSYPNIANLAYSQVAVAPSPATSGTSITVANGQGALFPSTNFCLTAYPPNSNPLASNAEILFCTSRTGDVFTVTRAQEGTSSKSILTGWQIANTATVLIFTEIINAIAASGGSAAWGGITGTLSSQTDLQTALNAKLNSSDIGTTVQGWDQALQDLAGISFAQGDIIYFNGTNLVKLSPGVSGQLLQTQGAGANPQWAAGGSGDLLAANNLTDVASIPTAFANIKQAATTADTGVAELATVAESGTGTDTSRIVTPAGIYPAEVDIASGSTTNIGGAASSQVRITGTVTITAFDTVAAGIKRFCRFSGVLILTHNASSLILPSGANITTAAGDALLAVSLGSGNWVVELYQKSNGQAIVGGSSGSNITSAAFASRPAPGNTGNLFLPSDGISTEFDNGAAWLPWGPLWPLTPIVDADYSWVNQAGATATPTKDALVLRNAGTGGLSLNGRVKTAPGTPYTITACLIPFMLGIAGKTYEYGIMFRASGAGTLATLSIGTNNTLVDPVITSRDWNSATSISTTTNQQGWQPTGPTWLRIQDDGANRIMSFSADGLSWNVFFTIGRTNFLTANQVGFFIMTTAGTTGMDPIGTFLSWLETTP